MSNLLEKGLSILKKIEEKGAEGEIYLLRKTSIEMKMRNDFLEYIGRKDTKGYGITLLKGRRAVFVDGTNLSSESIEDSIRTGLELLEVAKEDETNILPEYDGPYPNPPIFDIKTANLPKEKILSLMKQTHRAQKGEDARIRSTYYFSSVYEVSIVNSRGITNSYEGTTIHLGASTVVEKNGEKSEGYYSWSARRLEDIPDPAQIGVKSYKEAVSLLGGRPIKTQQMIVVLERRAAQHLLLAIFEALRGDNINKRKSFLVGKLGKKVFSEKLTIYDDGTIPWRVGSSPFDDEGIPSMRNCLIERGVPKGILDNTRSAKRGKRKPTGNAKRESYSSPPEIGFTNLLLEPGKRTMEEIISSVDKGIFVTLTMGFGVDPVSGNYSIGAAGRLIEKGELTKPVAGITIAGNLFDIFKEIVEVGCDLEFSGRIATPTIMIGEMMVGGHE